MDLYQATRTPAAAAMNPPAVRDVESSLAAWLKPDVACCIVKRERYEYPQGGFRVVTTYEVQGLPDQAHRDLVREAVDAFRAANQPAPYPLAVREIMRLRRMTETQDAQDDDDLEFTMGAMADEVARYPGDVVVEVLRARARKSRWWPALKDLLDELDAAAAKRRAMLRCLEQMAAKLEGEPEQSNVTRLVNHLAASMLLDR